MKHYIIPIAICFSILITACNIGRNENSNIVIEGYESNLKNEFVYLITSRNSQTSVSYYQALDSCLADSSGKYTFVIEASIPEFYQIRKSIGWDLYYGKDLYLLPGDSLRVNKSAKKIILSGSGAKLNQFQWDIEERLMEDSRIKKVYGNWNYLKLEPQAFIYFRDSLKQLQYQFYEEYFMDLTVPDEYEKYIHSKMHCHWVGDYLNYMKNQRHYSYDEWGYYLSVDSLDKEFIAHWQLDTTFHFTSSYRNCINEYVNNLYQYYSKDMVDSLRWDNKFSDKYYVIIENFEGIDRDIALIGLENEFWLYLMDSSNDFYRQAKQVMNFFSENYHSKVYYTYFSNQYNNYLKIAPGEPAPDFTFPDTSGYMVSLSDFKGQVVYMEFWGTWCAPCIQSIPKHLELQDKLKDQDNVVFLYVAMEYDEKNIERWKEFLKNMNFPGIHLVAKKQFLNEQLAPYKLRVAPTYVLIDKKGRISRMMAKGPASVYNDIVKVIDD